jgi:hypothetical protein
VVGCFALYFERGRVDGSLYNATPSVRLDTMARDSTRGVRSLTGLTVTGHPVSPRRAYARTSWMADSLTDSVRLSFVDGFSGAVFVLNAEAGRTDTLRGRVLESWDAGPPFETARGAAYAIREPCPP